MSDKRTPEERAREYAAVNYDAGMVFKELIPLINMCKKAAFGAFLAGYEHSRKDFIRDDLPKLLEMARETNECECEECDGTWCKPRKREKLHSNVEGLCKFVLKKAKETK